MLLLPPSNYRPVHQSRTVLKPSPLIFFSFPLITSQNPIVPRRVELRGVSLVVAAATAADTQAISQSAIERIAEKLRSLGYVEDNGTKENSEETLHRKANSASPGEIFVPLPTQLPKYRVGHTLDPSWSTPQNPVPLPGSGNAIQRFHDLRNEAKKAQDEEREKNKNEKKERVLTSAELTLPAKELSRLTTLGIRLKQKINIGKPGITEGIVNGIHERWRRSELVKIKCKDLCKMNMKRTHDMLERKTGGLVVWRSGSTIILYRGTDYKYPYFIYDNTSTNDALGDDSTDVHMDHGGNSGRETGSSAMEGVKSDGINGVSYPSLVKGVGSPNRVRFELVGEAELVEEADHMLEGLGPRFTDWWGDHPLPVDGDLLPAIIPGYRKPFRLLPYGVKPILTNDEMTTLKRLARPLPCHFALSRNRSLQGLAAAIVKLWEKCEIAKVAVKRGVQNTNSKLMAEQLKYLTGGILLARDKEYITLYRGKDFLPAAVSSAIEERRNQAIRGKHKGDCDSPVDDANEQTESIVESISGDENTCQNIKRIVQEKNLLISKEAAQSIMEFPSEGENMDGNTMEAAVKRTTDKLEATLEKKVKAEKLLEELDAEEISLQPDVDKEGISEEERYMLRRVGLRMKPFLLLGRRGVFSGTIENMHLHWKYRELVKIIAGRKGVEEVQQIARMLERESGGILVAIERTSKGCAIIVYRGKNYKRPDSLRPQTLLTKRQAMKRSIEAQRRESLKLHVLKLNQNIQDLRLKLELQRDSYMQSENKADVTFDANEHEHCDKLSSKEIESVPNSDMKSVASQVNSPKTNAAHCTAENKSKGVASRTVPLSNRERLTLRKQALTMKKRPVLAVGKNDIDNGVAKVIKAHFKKHPLAIVNVKGRAKGTSVREVASELEQATGSILVSQEPNKVILYRGWGAGLEATGDSRRGEQEVRALVSPELLSAIRLECGLQLNHHEEEEDAAELQ